jgi:hypothetical protein
MRQVWASWGVDGQLRVRVNSGGGEIIGKAGDQRMNYVVEGECCRSVAGGGANCVSELWIGASSDSPAASFPAAPARLTSANSRVLEKAAERRRNI